MRISRWHKVLSYFYDIEIETVESNVNGLLTLLISKGEYQLCTEEAIYSYGLKYYNFLEVFTKLELPKKGSDVLILGLGLGSIPAILENKYKREYNYTAVDIDEEIIRLASTYTLPELSSSVDVICTDAAFFVKVNEQEYDMICIDIFLGSEVPEQFETIDFLQKIKNRLSPNGLLIINRLYHYQKDKEISDKYFENIFQPIFKNSEAIQAHMNLMLVGRK